MLLAHSAAGAAGPQAPENIILLLRFANEASKTQQQKDSLWSAKPSKPLQRE
jgi:hypothetical protein